MKSISLTQGKITIVDDDDYDWLMQWKWSAVKNRAGYWYASRDRKAGKSVIMHRLIMNAPDGMEVDHRDNNGLHNWRTNLRLCTHTQNMQNRKAFKNSKTGYKGVTLEKETGRYRACIKANRKRYFLGRFDCAEDAARAYDAKAIELHGLFAKTNFWRL